jgi:hypothetical protein
MLLFPAILASMLTYLELINLANIEIPFVMGTKKGHSVKNGLIVKKVSIS